MKRIFSEFFSFLVIVFVLIVGIVFAQSGLPIPSTQTVQAQTVTCLPPLIPCVISGTVTCVPPGSCVLPPPPPPPGGPPPPPPGPPPPPSGTLIIKKEAVGGSDTFTFRASGTPINTSFSGPGQTTVSAVPVGSFTLTEKSPIPTSGPGWAFDDASCTAPSSSSPPTGPPPPPTGPTPPPSTLPPIFPPGGPAPTGSSLPPAGPPPPPAGNCCVVPALCGAGFFCAPGCTCLPTSAVPPPPAGFLTGPPPPPPASLAPGGPGEGACANPIICSPGFFWDPVSCSCIPDIVGFGPRFLSNEVFKNSDYSFSGQILSLKNKLSDFSAQLLGINSLQPAEVIAQTSLPSLPSASGYIADGKTTTCTFSNAKQATVKLIKNTHGGDTDAAFAYNFVMTDRNIGHPTTLNTAPNDPVVVANTPVPPDPFDFTGKNEVYLDPGEYKITEVLPGPEEPERNQGWTLTDAHCVSSSGTGGSTTTGYYTTFGVSNVVLDPGATVTCTFENDGTGKLKIVTQTVGLVWGYGGEYFDYKIERFDPGISVPSNSNSLTVYISRLDREDELRGDEWSGDEEIDVPKGISAYRITEEEVPEGWALTNVSCVVTALGGESNSPTGERTEFAYGIQGVDVRGGRTTTCTFVNTKKGEVEVVQKPPKSSSGSASGDFDYNILFQTSDYYPSNILPFSLKPGACGDGTCSEDEDCTICEDDCGGCNNPQPPRPDRNESSRAYSPTRLTVQSDVTDVKRVYPGFYNLKQIPPYTAPSKPSWFLDEFECKLENGDTVGKQAGDQILEIPVYAGKKTKCEVTDELSEIKKDAEGATGKPMESDLPE